MLDFKRFGESDWMGFAGAEQFPNGGAPLIAEMQLDDNTGVDKTGIVIVDASGICIHVTDARGEDLGTFHVPTVDPLGMAWTLNAVLALEPRMSTLQLDALGFVDDR
jgi:hypothetical protein